MKDLLDKISSYNLFNYLLPGTIFVTLANKFTRYSFIEKNIIIAGFVYYFVGLIISRLGSLIIEPVLKKIKFLKFTDYKEFILASKKDPKIEIFSETNNTYRTLSAMFIFLLLLKLYELVEFKLPMLMIFSPYILVILLLTMFIFSYRKQTEYIKKRVKVINE